MVTVEARSLYHAVGVAIARFRASDLPCDPGPLTRFVVESREASIQHTVTPKQFEEWLARPGGSPAEVAQRSDLRELLKGTEAVPETRRAKRWH